MRDTLNRRKAAELHDLYALARRNNIDVLCFKLPKTRAVAILDESGQSHIAIDPMLLQSEHEERELLAHELGHCETGGFYSLASPFCVRAKMERQAEAWAIEALVPKRQLQSEVDAGYREVWQLAERFRVSEALMQKAIAYHQNNETR